MLEIFFYYTPIDNYGAMSPSNFLKIFFILFFTMSSNSFIYTVAPKKITFMPPTLQDYPQACMSPMLFTWGRP